MTVRTAADYAGALRALMPTGRVWPSDPNTDQQRALAALSNLPARLDRAADHLLAGALPGDSLDLLPEWEVSLGLPDPCAGSDPTIAARVNQVRARFIGSGGQSVPFFTAFCSALGFTVQIEPYAPFRVGHTAGEPLYGDDWIFAWAVRILASSDVVSIDVLLCELNALKPAHTCVFLI